MSELNKFEKTRLLSARANELANGAKPLIDLKKNGFDKPELSREFVKIAEKEFELGKLDLEVYK